MEQDFLDHLRLKLDRDIVASSPISGGDINEAYLLETSVGKYFIKRNDDANAEAMFACEAFALEKIISSKAIATPKVISTGKHNHHAYLVLEYIESSPAVNPKHQEVFGQALAKLHSQSNKSFGWKTDNFIGTLEQKNQNYDDWDEFYITQRIEKHITLARTKEYLTSLKLSSINRFYKEISMLLEKAIPSLLHGDLWAGNYIIDQGGKAYLIDPASYFGHSEVDLAMSELFGGFSEAFYVGYNAINKIPEGYSERKEIYQLYYLLVHLNLFGRSYEMSCSEIICKFD